MKNETRKSDISPGHDQLLIFAKKNCYDLPFPANENLRLKPFDRTVSRLKYKGCNSFKFKLEAETIADLLKVSSQNKTFTECCLQRAHDLLQLDREKYYLAYSGGIDSTTALVALLEAWPASELKRISILLSKHSIIENPSFFERHVVQFPLITSMQDFCHLFLNTKNLLITGELGDQLFGSDILMNACRILGDQIIKQDYRVILPKVFDILCKEEGRGVHMLELFEPIVAECPFNIQSAHDFLWWFNFTQKWQIVKFRFMEPVGWNVTADYGKNVLHFFDTVAFQHWSLENQDLKIRSSWDSYKFTAKEFIYRFTKDSAQLGLLKKQSLVNTYFFDERKIAITTSRRVIANYEELRGYVQA